MVRISSNFDSGKIEVVKADDPQDIQLNIGHDSNSEFFQWFHFRLQGAQGVPCTLRLLNAGQSTYPEGWEDYQACASYDGLDWFRVKTSYDGKALTIEHEPEYDSVFYAYFAPYSFERHLELVNTAQMSPLCKLHHLGQTVEGRDFNLLEISDTPNPEKTIWIIARQHPGESMAEWYMEGLIESLLDSDNSVARVLLKKTRFFLVPSMNPDGAAKGNLRANAAGANLNREWMEPSLERSPEVYYVREKMQETGVDLFLDIHGDEAIPYNFAATSEGVPAYTEKMAELEQLFIRKYVEMTPDFQDTHGYPKDEPGAANLTVASNYVAEHFQCLALTIEQPFKDDLNAPDAERGWSPERAQKLGADVLPVIYAVLPRL
jgi:murein tripeptide amidase MpaA